MSELEGKSAHSSKQTPSRPSWSAKDTETIKSLVADHPKADWEALQKIIKNGDGKNIADRETFTGEQWMALCAERASKDPSRRTYDAICTRHFPKLVKKPLEVKYGELTAEDKRKWVEKYKSQSTTGGYALDLKDSKTSEYVYAT
ncbi:uncharacterized protein Bfra_010575 [Botrytis fragariae]|uniref:Myb-like domain-containing protein n=1 Tax=Botrytis fragariae TaxID=1964551 RepID=A0A8H6ED98_9HELO|nr:uncharacterized protein Bfra_010575 [Botrytis fragariae]KAF5867600.1 hypothetical protein Bfra_010575 [Botrytis fragariae]